jgi:hypothetical protein
VHPAHPPSSFGRARSRILKFTDNCPWRSE